MLVTALILSPFGVALAVLLLPASRRRGRVSTVAGRPAVPPARDPRAPRGAAVPKPEVQPPSVMTEPFAYSNGLTIGPGPGTEDPS